MSKHTFDSEIRAGRGARLSRRALLRGLGASAGLGLGGALLGGALPTSTAWAKQVPAPFPELLLRGSAGQIGLLHGKTFATQIGRNVGFYLKWFEQVIKLPPKRALMVAKGFEAVLRKHTPALLEEIDGIAKGAKQSREAILALNARTDMLVVGRSKAARGSKHALLSPFEALHASFDHDLTRPGCTALALRGGTAKRPLLALGQNWDWRRALAGNVVVLRIERKGALPLVTFTEAGMVGKIGFNARRLGVCLNFLSHKSEDPEGSYGVPVHVLLRAVMEAESLDAAVKLVDKAPRCASANFLMAQHDRRRGGKPQALDLEWTPKAVAKLPLGGAALVHTNHFRADSLRGGCDSGFGKSTMNRFQVATARARRLKVTVSDPAKRMQTILADRQGAPYSVSKSAVKGSSSETLAGIVMDLSGGALYLCAGQPHRGRFTRHRGV